MSWSSDRRTRDQLVGVLLILLALGAVVSLAVWKFHAGGARVTVDEKLCPVEGGPHAYVAILLDLTDPPTAIQRAALEKELVEVEAELPTYSRIQIFRLRSSDGESLPAPVFDMCKPPSGEEASAFTENPAHIRKRWEEQYHVPLERALRQVAEDTGEKTSPIMELIQAAAVTAFPSRSQKVPRRLIVASDFLQNTKEYSHYRGGIPQFTTFLKNDVARRVRSDLSQFDVTMLYLRREHQGAVQTPEHVEFWRRYFVWCGVGEGHLLVTPIEG